ncbi:MAG: hypothetical protein GC162_17220 [Planctomycetes bacterium]|nr:hypothetical protein [Planctomycetota bacterium]
MNRRKNGWNIVKQCALLMLPVSLAAGEAAHAALVNRYSFTTDASDSVSAANGTLQSGASVSGGAVQLNGTNQYVSLPAGIMSGDTSFTIEGWFTYTANGNWTRLFDFGNDTAHYLFLSPNAGGSNAPRYAIKNGGTELQANATGGMANGYHFAAVTYDSATTTANLYIDGVLAGTNTGLNINPSNLGSTANNYLGKSQFADPYFKGSIDEFRIYNTTRGADQIAADFAAGADTSVQANLAVLGDWKFAQNGNNVAVSNGQVIGTGNFTAANLLDSSNNHHTGNVVGTPHYQTFDPFTVGRAGSDGYAVHTGATGAGQGNLYFNANADLQAISNFSVWTRFNLQSYSNSGGNFVLLDQPNTWFVFVANNASHHLMVNFGGADTNIDLGLTINTNTWYDLGFSFDGIGSDANPDTLTIYLNGQVISTLTGAASMTVHDWFHIGSSGNNTQTADALFDRVIFWSGVADNATFQSLSILVPAPAALPAGLALMGMLTLRRRGR